MSEIRIGRISSVNYAKGTARVVYSDKNNATTPMLPILSYEYNMPEIDDLVLVLNTSNGKGEAVIIGSFWGQKLPDESGKGLYKKNLCKSGDAYLKCAGNNITMKGGSVTFQGSTGSITLDEIIQLKETVKRLEQYHQ